jgi:glucose-1-phosphate thymidylyltransferase
MIDSGKRLQTAEVAGWYDCGKVETVLSTNLHLLQHGRQRRPARAAGVTIIDPVFVADGGVLEDCTIGPNVSVDAGATIRRSTLRDAIVGQHAVVEDSTVTHSLIGDDARVVGATFDNMVVAKDEVGEAP